MPVFLGVFALLSFTIQSSLAEIKIGAMTCLTGAFSTFGVSSIQGARLAVEEINAAGGTLGQPIQLIVEDNGSKAGETATITRKFISQDKVVAILGDLTSSATMEGAPLAQAAKIPLLTPSATNVAITKIGNYIFRSCFIDPFTGKIMAKFALDRLKAKQAIVMTDVKQDYSVGLTDAIRQYFTQNGGGIAETFSYSSGDTNFRTQLTGSPDGASGCCFPARILHRGGADPSSGQTTRNHLPICRRRRLGQSGAGRGCRQSRRRELLYRPFLGRDPDPKVQKFVQTYRAKYGALPDALAALWYDGARLLSQAIKRAGSTDAAKIRDALAATRDFEGVTGRISIDENRNASKPGVILKIDNGEPEMVQQITP